MQFSFCAYRLGSRLPSRDRLQTVLSAAAHRGRYQNAGGGLAAPDLLAQVCAGTVPKPTASHATPDLLNAEAILRREGTAVFKGAAQPMRRTSAQQRQGAAATTLHQKVERTSMFWNMD